MSNVEDINEQMRASIEAKISAVSERKEEILEAFVAKYGFEPRRIVQVIEECKGGIVKHTVIHLNDHKFDILKQHEARIKQLEMAMFNAINNIHSGAERIAANDLLKELQGGNEDED